MKKLYVVTSGEYSDYGIDAIFSSEELAQKFIDSFAKEGYSRFNEIKTYSLDPFQRELREDYKPYFLRMDKNGKASDIHIEDSAYGFIEAGYESGFSVKDDMFTHCYAKDEKHAIKICNERRVQLIANNKWPIKQ